MLQDGLIFVVGLSLPLTILTWISDDWETATSMFWHMGRRLGFIWLLLIWATA